MIKFQHRGNRLTKRALFGLNQAGALVAILLTGGAARATTIAVTTTSMSVTNGDGCGLMEAVRAVNTGAAVFECPAGNGSSDKITLKVGTYTLTAPLDFTRSVVIASATPNVYVSLRSSNNAQQLIYASNAVRPVNLTLEDLDMQGTMGTSQDGVKAVGNGTEKLTVRRCQIARFYRGIDASGVDLDVLDSRIVENHAGGEGGGIKHFGLTGAVMNIRNSEIADNFASEDGGGIHFSADGPSSIVNSTIGHNIAGTSGGGIHIVPQFANAVFTITASTIAWNSAPAGGGVESYGGYYTTNVNESIIGNNDAPDSPDWVGTIDSFNNSLISNNQGVTIASAFHSQVNIDPGFYNDFPWTVGGRTLVFALAPSSAAVDWNPSSSQTVDQRGFPRGVDGGPLANRFDIGAYEYDPSYQTELLTVAAKSSDTHGVSTASEFSNGKGTNLQSNAVGDYVTYAVPMIRDECVSIAVGVRRTNNSAKVQVEYNIPSNDNVYAPLGPVIDLWASAPIFKELSLATNVKVIRDPTNIRFRVVGRNSANTTGYQMFPDYIRFGNPGSGTCLTICATPPCPAYQ